MQSGVIRCVGIPADASVLDCGLCHVVFTLGACQHRCGAQREEESNLMEMLTETNQTSNYQD